MKQEAIQQVDRDCTSSEFIRYFSDDESCRAYLEAKRWPDGPVCPHCPGGKHVSTLNGSAHRKGVYTCGACRRQFTVTVGTIFEGSHLPLPKWFEAIYLMCTCKKGVSAHQLHRMLRVTYKTAWFMCHRIRLAMRTQAFSGFLSGTVEADETYSGGKQSGKRGRGAAGKTVVFAMVERGGAVNAQVVPDITKDTLQAMIAQTVVTGSRVMTDEFKSYLGLSLGYQHGVVEHCKGFVSGGDVHTNNAESFFALFKRGVHGTFHHVSKAKADMYCGEFGFRFGSSGLTDMERFVNVVTNCGGRLRWNFRDGGN